MYVGSAGLSVLSLGESGLNVFPIYSLWYRLHSGVLYPSYLKCANHPSIHSSIFTVCPLGTMYHGVDVYMDVMQ